MKKKSWRLLGTVLLMMALLTGCLTDKNPDKISTENPQSVNTTQEESAEAPKAPDIKEEKESTAEKLAIREDGQYHSKEEVAAYIHTFHKLPANYITKKEAAELGWKTREGNLWEVAEGKSIGGDLFGNREKLLPDQKGRKWYECDIDYQGGYRNEKRILYSNDGLIFYTEDHYKSFEQLYE